MYKKDKNDGGAAVNPFANLEKTPVLQQARIINESPVNPRRCTQTLLRMMPTNHHSIVGNGGGSFVGSGGRFASDGGGFVGNGGNFVEGGSDGGYEYRSPTTFFNTPPPQMMTTVRRYKQKFTYSLCVFCKNNGENESYFMSHTLKDRTGKVICPILSAYVCPVCQATGPLAHTVKYCPQNRDGDSKFNCVGIHHEPEAPSLLHSEEVRRHSPVIKRGRQTRILKVLSPY